MSVPSGSTALYLQILPKSFRVFKILPSAPFPLALLGILQKAPVLSQEEFISITRNAGEVSVVTDHEFIESDELNVCEEGGRWKCIKVKGPLEHSAYACWFATSARLIKWVADMHIGMTGVLAALSAPLRDANVPIFVISTWCATK